MRRFADFARELFATWWARLFVLLAAVSTLATYVASFKPGFVVPQWVLAVISLVAWFLAPFDMYRRQRVEIERFRQLSEKLKSKPQRTPAEQHDYDTAKKALQRFGHKAVIALRHLRTHGALTFGTLDPPLPAGMKRDDVVWAYNACAGEGLVTYREKFGSGERTFEIAPTMKRILDELLYESDGTTSAG